MDGNEQGPSGCMIVTAFVAAIMVGGALIRCAVGPEKYDKQIADQREREWKESVRQSDEMERARRRAEIEDELKKQELRRNGYR